MTRPDPDSGESRAAGQPDAFGDWFSTTPVPPRSGPPQVGRPSVRPPRGSPPKVRRPRVRRSRGSPPRARQPGRDRFWWLLSPWLLAPTAAVAVATTGIALWLWQSALTGTVQARPGSAVTAAPAASAGGLTDGPARPLQVRPPLPREVTSAPAVSSQAQAPADIIPVQPAPVTSTVPVEVPSPTMVAPPPTTAPEPSPTTSTPPPPEPVTTPPSEPVTTPPSEPVTTPPSEPVTTPPSPPVTSPASLPASLPRLLSRILPRQPAPVTGHLAAALKTGSRS